LQAFRSYVVQDKPEFHADLFERRNAKTGKYELVMISADPAGRKHPVMLVEGNRATPARLEEFGYGQPLWHKTRVAVTALNASGNRLPAGQSGGFNRGNAWDAVVGAGSSVVDVVAALPWAVEGAVRSGSTIPKWLQATGEGLLGDLTRRKPDPRGASNLVLTERRSQFAYGSVVADGVRKVKTAIANALGANPGTLAYEVGGVIGPHLIAGKASGAKGGALSRGLDRGKVATINANIANIAKGGAPGGALPRGLDPSKVATINANIAKAPLHEVVDTVKRMTPEFIARMKTHPAAAGTFNALKARLTSAAGTSPDAARQLQRLGGVRGSPIGPVTTTAPSLTRPQSPPSPRPVPVPPVEIAKYTPAGSAEQLTLFRQPNNNNNLVAQRQNGKLIDLKTRDIEQAKKTLNGMQRPAQRVRATTTPVVKTPPVKTSPSVVNTSPPSRVIRDNKAAGGLGWDGSKSISPNPPGDPLGQPLAQPRVQPQTSNQLPFAEPRSKRLLDIQPPPGKTSPGDITRPNSNANPLSVSGQAVATGDEVVKTVNLFTSPDSVLPPDMQFKLGPILPRYMRRFEGRDFKLVLADSSAGGRVAAPNLLNGFKEATGTLPSTAVLGDDRFAPYGVLTPDQLRLHTNNMFTVGNALDPDCTAGVCNTFHIAVDSGLSALEDPNSPPYVHLIRTTAAAMKEAAAQGDTKQVLLATPATVSSGIYTRHIDEATGGQLKVIQIAAPAFAPAVNNADHLKPAGSPERIALDRAADEYVKLIPDDATSVWLCCTHYPALTSTIEAALQRAGKGHIRIVDPMREQGYKVAEQFWEWKLSGGPKTPGADFRPFMVTSAGQEDLPGIASIGNQFFNQGDPDKPTIPLISVGPYGEVTPDRLQRAIDSLPGNKPNIDPSKLRGQPRDPKNERLPPTQGPDLTGLPSPQTLQTIAGNEPPTRWKQFTDQNGLWDGTNRVDPGPGIVGGTSQQPGTTTPASASTPWALLDTLTPANQKSVGESFAKYQEAGGTKTPEQFFNGTSQDPGVMQIFDEQKFLRGTGPSIPKVAETLATQQVQTAAFVDQEQRLLNDAYQSYSLTAVFHPYSDRSPVRTPAGFVTKLSKDYLDAGGQNGTGKSLGAYAVDKYPPVETSAFFQNPVEMARRYPHLSLDERDKIVSLAQKTELLQREIIPYYQTHPLIENGQKLVWHNPVTNRLEIDTNFLISDPRANGVFPDGKKPALDLNALIGRTDRYDLPSKLVQLVMPTTRPTSVDPKTGDQFIRPGFDHTNNKWVLSATEKAYLPKVFAGEPRLQAIEAQKQVELAKVPAHDRTARKEITQRFDVQAEPIKAEVTETYLAKRRNWSSFVIHALEVLRLPRTEVAAMLADQQIASPPPPIGGPRGINVPQISGSGVQPVRDLVTGLQTVTYVDLGNIKTADLAAGNFKNVDVEGRGPSFGQAILNANHGRGEITKNIALTALIFTGANFVNTAVIQPLMKKPDPAPMPPIEKLTASVQELNRTMQGLAVQSGTLPTSLDRIALPKAGLTLFLSPVGNLPKNAVRPTFEQLVQTAIQTNGKILQDAGVDTEKLLEAARRLDAAKAQTGAGTTIPQVSKSTP
jgi:glutamate racemase